MKKLITLAAFAAASLVPACAEDFRVLSPDGLTYADLHLADGRLTYTVGLRKALPPKKRGAKADTLDIPLLEPSPLGLYTNVADFSRGLSLVREVRPEGTVTRHYRLRQGKQSDITSSENGLSLILSTPAAKKLGLAMAVNFRVFDNNVAYNYRFLQGGETAALVVTGEASGFDLPAGTTAFICPQSDPMVGWKRTKPSYEEEYLWDAPATTASKYGRGWTFPCLFRQGTNWLLISETGVTSGYCASHLTDATPDGLMTIAFPMPEENNGFGSTGAQLGLADSHVTPYDVQTQFTPYRTLTLGSSLKPIVETTIPWDVVEQLYEPAADYRGSRNTWSWIVWQDNSINFDDQVAFIHLAAELGWEGCLIDGGWHQNIGRKGMEQLFGLCREKGIRPWVWYNSNGGWNDAPQCARQAMHNPIVRKAEMRWLRDHNVAGIKVDFFGGDKQETMRLYEAILSDANDFGIQVIFHGCTLPRGWERMYPNYCGSEAVLASENLIFNQHFCDMEAKNACLHPFVRNTVGSMEFGGTLLQRRLNRGNDGGTVRRTGDVFELATAVAFQCSGQNFGLTPRNLTEQPSFEIDFMRSVPTTWDETRFLDGYPGEYIVLARRHADRWYVVAMNAGTEARPLQVDLSGFGLPSSPTGFTTLLHDGADGRTPQSSPLRTDKKGRLQLTLQPACGAVVF